jgi:hypothetical protein
LYDIPQAIFGLKFVQADPEEARIRAKEMIRGLLLDKNEGPSTMKKVDCMLSYIMLEYLGDRGEQYPWWTPDPVGHTVTLRMKVVADNSIVGYDGPDGRCGVKV